MENTGKVIRIFNLGFIEKQISFWDFGDILVNGILIY